MRFFDLAKTNGESNRKLNRASNAVIFAAQIKAKADLEAARLTAAANLKMSQDTNAALDRQTAASAQAAKDGGIAAVIAGIAGAHTTTETIKQMLPSEVGAATVQSWELAQKWNKTISMQTQGYQGVAINYELGGKDGRALQQDAQYNSMQMAQENKKSMTSAIQMFGIQSENNPYGVAVSADEWAKLHSMKDPKELLTVDPVVAAQRQVDMAKWKSDMNAQGMGLIVDMYENPQLGGSNILTMKGKESMIPPELQGLISQMGGGAGGGVQWDEVLAAQAGTQNKYSGQITALQNSGVLDKYGMVNAGELMKFVPPSISEPPAFEMYNKLSEQDKARLQDDYNKYSTIKLDPKLVRQESLGMGVSRKVKLNPDGTIAGHVLEGYMTDKMGNQTFSSVAGGNLQDWYDQQSKISGMGPLFPSFIAPPSSEMRSGKFEPGFWGDNVLATANNGTPGFQAVTKPYGSHPQEKPVQSMAPSPAPNTSGAIGPAGYNGVPLAAGG